jgi:hypothetical protein
MNIATDEEGRDLDEAEAARRRDEVVKRMLATPPQPRAKPPRKANPKAPADD